MAIDHAEVSKAIMTAMANDATVAGLVAARIYNRVWRSPTFPFVRFLQLPAVPYDGKMGPTWLWDHTVDFTVFTNKTSVAQAADITKAISDVMEDKSNLTVTGASIIFIRPRQQGCDWDEDTETWTGLASFQIVLEEA